MEKDTHKRTGPRRERDTFQGLSQNSKVSYFNKLRACINHAYDERIIPYNPLRGIEGFKEAEVKRDYLTLEEIRKLAATPSPISSPETHVSFLMPDRPPKKRHSKTDLGRSAKIRRLYANRVQTEENRRSGIP